MEKKRVLIVDDALFMRNLIRSILVKAGFEICGEASNALEGVRKYKELKPDVVTLDIIMPMMEEMDGVKAVKEIVNFDPQAKIVVVSALGDRRLVQEALAYGARDFVIKPFTAEKLLEVIRKAIS
ncbi:MAG: response regulator [Candidatus Omnitrophota bacterium]|nr:MAG: response regulator [Candidatus Omnitrophota bacterium]